MMKRSAIIEACNCNCLISHMPKVIASFPPFRGIPLATRAIHMVRHPSCHTRDPHGHAV